MATLRKWVSDVRGMHKMLSTDGLITDRLIASEIRNSTIMFIKRETNLRKLWSTDTIFQTLPCLEMVEVPISECCDYADPCSVARSKYKLPRISEGNYQYMIQGVWSINAMGGMGTKFTETTINRYANLLKLPVVKKGHYYWIVNGYLYTNNPLIQAVRIAAFFEEDFKSDLKSADCCGQQMPLEEKCKNPLDMDFPLPGYLGEQVLQTVSQKLLNTYFRINDDKTSDNKDDQVNKQ